MALTTTGNITNVPQTAVLNPARPATNVALPVLSSQAAGAAQSLLDAPSASVSRSEAAIQLERVQRAIDQLKQSIKPTLANSLEFEIDQGSGKTVVKILDRETNAVVRQIPSEEMLAIARALEQMQGRGGLLQNRA